MPFISDSHPEAERFASLRRPPVGHDPIRDGMRGYGPYYILDRLLKVGWDNGWSEWVEREEWVAKGFDDSTNGAGWMRSLEQFFVVRRRHVKGKLQALRLEGYRTTERHDKTIPSHIYDLFEGLPKEQRVSAWGGSSRNLRLDHCNGRYTDSYFNPDDPKEYQYLTEEENCRKREHCQICKDTRRRFDAKSKLGYSVPVTHGTLDYVDSCFGCYLFDCLFFKKHVSANCVVDMPIGTVIDSGQSKGQRDVRLSGKQEISQPVDVQQDTLVSFVAEFERDTVR